LADSGAEKEIRKFIEKAKSFEIEHQEFDLIKCGKPSVAGGGGETKTDIYLLAKSKTDGKSKEIKISYKKPTFSFVENKIRKPRAKAIYGTNWSKIIRSQIYQIKKNFLKKPLIYFEKEGRNEKGVITLGWRYEMEHDGTRKMGVKIKHDVASQVWKNKNADEKYVHGIIDGKEIQFSGMPNYCLNIDPKNVKNEKDVFKNLVSMDELVKTHGNISAAFLAQNYRTQKQKQEGNTRHLAVWIDWKIVQGKLGCAYVFDKPLEMESGKAFENLKDSLAKLGHDVTDTNFKIDSIKKSIHSSVPVFP